VHPARDIGEIARVALATSEQARTEEGMLYHLDGTPYMNVADYFESPAEQAAATGEDAPPDGEQVA
jgi:hypothetical protein